MGTILRVPELLVVANGRMAQSRKWDRAVARLRSLFAGRIEIRVTSGRGDATRLAREALGEGVSWLAAAGGDGTINEVVNGLVGAEGRAHPEATLSFLPCGTANDWVRTLGVPLRLDEAIDTLPGAAVRTVDVGVAEFPRLGCRRAFLNFAEIGAGSEVIRRIEARSGPSWRGKYLLAAVAVAFSYRPRSLEMSIDAGPPERSGPLLSLVAAGGRYFGSGIHVAPMARPDDGLFELISIGDFGKLEVLRKIGSFVRGEYLHEPKVRHRSVGTVRLSSETAMPVVLDGELAGELPVWLSVLPRALRVRC